jgi:hypothetical protein
MNSKLAHWPPFWDAAIKHIRKEYPNDDPKGYPLKAFLYGIISHAISDAAWHSLNMEQGFIDAMRFINYNGNYPEAHSDADIGGDLLIARSGKLAYLSLIWKVPTWDIIQIYKSLGRTVSESNMNHCMTAGYALLQANRALGKYLLPRWARFSNFLVDNYFSYFRGGVQAMALTVVDCWARADEWIQSGIITECKYLGSYYRRKQLGSTQFLSRVSECAVKHPGLTLKIIDSNSHTITSSTLQTAYISYCIWKNKSLLSKNNQESLLDRLNNGVFASALNVAHALWQGFGALFSKRCQICSGPTLTTSKSYSLFGKSMAVGDFDADGMLDVAIGSPGMQVNGSGMAGGLYLVKGPLTLPSISNDIESIGKLIVSDRIEFGSQFAHSMAIVDLNSDGIDDLAISQPFSGFSNDEYHGIVHVIFGRKNLGLRIDGSYDIQIRYRKRDASDSRIGAFGTKLFSFDVDGDGFADLLIGSPFLSPTDSGVQRGAVHAFLSSSRHQGIKSHSECDWALTGAQNFAWFGHAVSVSSTKLFIGAPNAEISDTSSGRVYVYNLGATGRSPVFEKSYGGQDGHTQFGFFISQSIRTGNGSYLAIGIPTANSASGIAVPSNFPGVLIPKDKNGFQAGMIGLWDTRESMKFLDGHASLGHFGSKINPAGDKGIIITEPTSISERGRMYFVSDLNFKESRVPIRDMFNLCWQGDFHSKFGDNFVIGDFDNDRKLDLMVSMENDPVSKNTWSFGMLNGKVQIIFNAFSE